jgi:hypothetical protein
VDLANVVDEAINDLDEVRFALRDLVMASAPVELAPAAELGDQPADRIANLELV